MLSQNFQTMMALLIVLVSNRRIFVVEGERTKSNIAPPTTASASSKSVSSDSSTGAFRRLPVSRYVCGKGFDLRVIYLIKV